MAPVTSLLAPYGSHFHRLGALRSARSARVIVPRVAAWLAPASVVDVGCGAGAWLQAWKGNGATDAVGVDQELDRSTLLIDERDLVVADLARPLRLGRTFDLAQSLEVAEHLPPEAAEGFVAALTDLAPVVLFSAALPGQLGDHHVNERSPGYWRALFEARGYVPFDPLRPLLRGDRRVSSWYRYNVLLYGRRSELDALPHEVRWHRIADGAPVPDFRPAPLRAAMKALSLLPPRGVQLLASAERLVRGAFTRTRNA